jgi:F-type H+-transporting ATPase subunit alpha
MKKVSGKIRLELAQFRELEAFMQFSSDLDADTKARIDSGRKYVEMLKQGQNDPMPFYKQVVSIYGANNGLYEGTTPEKVRDIEPAFLSFVERSDKSVFDQLEKGRELTDELVGKIEGLIKSFKEANSQFYGL